MLHKNCLLAFLSAFAFANLTCIDSFANSRLRAGILSGLGFTSSTNQITKNESPIGFNFHLDYVSSPSWVIGVEHHRTFSGAASASSFSSILTRWYFLNSVPSIKKDLNELENDTITQTQWSPYIGIAGGFAQTTYPAKDEDSNASASGLFGEIKGGIDYPFWGRLGLRGEGLLAVQLVGTGSIIGIAFVGGIYYVF